MPAAVPQTASAFYGVDPANASPELSMSRLRHLGASCRYEPNGSCSVTLPGGKTLSFGTAAELGAFAFRQPLTATERRYAAQLADDIARARPSRQALVDQVLATGGAR